MSNSDSLDAVINTLGYSNGLVKDIQDAQTPVQSYLFSEAKRLISDVDALFFSGDMPIAYFKNLSSYDAEAVAKLHKEVWNQNRVPLLFVVSPSEIRIYNCFERPADPTRGECIDSEERLITSINLVTETMEKLRSFSHEQIGTGTLWKSEIGKRFRADNRVDYTLLQNIASARERLHQKGLDYQIIHNLLGRSIFVLYLEDRGAIVPDYYKQFLEGAETYYHIIQNRESTYALFNKLEQKFNGDLFPVTPSELESVNESHLALVGELLYGTNMTTGQRTLWRPYDFGIIPIELISAIYEEFMHKEVGRGHASQVGAFYTPHELVEFIMNEALPWPSASDSDYNKKILDPACGSGVFLVEAFRRLVARFEFSNGRSANPSELVDLLVNRIYGVDIEGDAIKVAAFSLYLALLDYLEPKTIWKQFRFPYLINTGGKDTRDGSNLFITDILEKGEPFEEIGYDLIIGNPPWKRNNLPSKMANYLRERNYPQEAAIAFLERARELTDKGTIALLAPGKLLFNQKRLDQYFRECFFGKNYVEMIIDFSSLRRVRNDAGKQLFPNAVAPAIAIFFRPSIPEKPRPSILFYSPKPTITGRALPGIFIDPSEIKHIPRTENVHLSEIWKIAIWGTQRDFELIEKLQRMAKLRGYITGCDSSSEWKKGVGYEAATMLGRSRPNIELSNMKFIDSRDLTRYRIDPSKIDKVKDIKFYREGCIEAYYGPHVLIKEGQHNKRFCAAYTEEDCAFKKTIAGVTGPSDQKDLMKGLTVYLNSAFSEYFLFLTSSTWGVERERVLPSEVFNLPALPFLVKGKQRERLSELYDELAITIEEKGYDSPEIIRLENEANEEIFRILELSTEEKSLIMDTLTNGIDLLNSGEKSSACKPASSRDLEEYAKVYCNEINKVLQYGNNRASATVYSGISSLKLISIHFHQNSDDSDKQEIKIIESSEKLSKSLHDLDKIVSEHYSRGVFVRRNVKLFQKNVLNIIKQGDRRFWSASMALRDADELLADGIRPRRG